MGCAPSSTTSGAASEQATPALVMCAELSGRQGSRGSLLLSKLPSFVGHASTPEEELRQDKAFFGAFSLGPKLGRGSFAQVRAARHRDTGFDLAVKVVDVRQHDVLEDQRPSELCPLLDAQRLDYLRREVENWRRASGGKHVVGLAGTFLEAGVAFMVMERCECSLRTYLRNGAGRAELDEQGLAGFLTHGLQALAHIHGIRIVHRDVQPDNFVVQGDVVKLCDFGLSSSLPVGDCLWDIVGLPQYLAPEMLFGLGYGLSVDIWALGVVFYLFLYGQFPYREKRRGSKDVMEAIYFGAKRPRFEPARRLSKGGDAPAISPDAEQLCRIFLDRAPCRRQTAKKLLRCHHLTNILTDQGPRPFSSLAPALAAATKVGAFHARRVHIDLGLDEWLAKLKKKSDEELGFPSHELSMDDDRLVSTRSVDSFASHLSSSAWDSSEQPAEPCSPSTPSTLASSPTRARKQQWSMEASVVEDQDEDEVSLPQPLVGAAEAVKSAERDGTRSFSKETQSTTCSGFESDQELDVELDDHFTIAPDYDEAGVEEPEGLVSV